MAFFPKIQRPCPYKSDLAAVMDGDFCRMCHRNVFDITDWSDGERVAFLAGCADKVCVSYRVPLRPAVAAAAIAALAVPTAAAAQDCPDIQVIVGGIDDPANVQFVDTSADAAIPDLPIVYEDAPAAATTTPGPDARPAPAPAPAPAASHAGP